MISAEPEKVSPEKSADGNGRVDSSLPTSEKNIATVKKRYFCKLRTQINLGVGTLFIKTFASRAYFGMSTFVTSKIQNTNFDN